MAGQPDPAAPRPDAPDSAAGAPGPGPQDEIDAARAALNRARDAAQARGEVRVRATGPLVRDPNAPAPPRRARPAEGYSGRDPLGLGSVVSRMVAERGWSSPVAVGSVMSRWRELVGEDIAAHCTPESFEGTVLRVRCDSTAWATQLRLMSTALLDRFRRELGDGVVTSLHVLGPAAPSWRKGSRHVKGRGPRDTYG